EVEVGGTGERAEEVARLAQPPEPRRHAIPAAPDNDVEARADHRDCKLQIANCRLDCRLDCRFDCRLLCDFKLACPRQFALTMSICLLRFSPQLAVRFAICNSICNLQFNLQSAICNLQFHESCPVTCMKICSRFEPAATRSAREASSATVPSAT